MVLARGEASQCREDAPCVFNSHRPNMIKKKKILWKNLEVFFLRMSFWIWFLLSKRKHWSVLRSCQGGEVTSFEMSVDFWIQTSPLKWTRKDLDFSNRSGLCCFCSTSTERERKKKNLQSLIPQTAAPQVHWLSVWAKTATCRWPRPFQHVTVNNLGLGRCRPKQSPVFTQSGNG